MPSASALSRGHIKAGLVNLVGEILERREADVDTHDQRRTIASMAALIGELRRCAGKSGRLWGVALPGPLHTGGPPRT
jgi:predicted NBD/HSP70 family sugar kinase